MMTGSDIETRDEAHEASDYRGDSATHSRSVDMGGFWWVARSGANIVSYPFKLAWRHPKTTAFITAAGLTVVGVHQGLEWKHHRDEVARVKEQNLVIETSLRERAANDFGVTVDAYQIEGSQRVGIGCENVKGVETPDKLIAFGYNPTTSEAGEELVLPKSSITVKDFDGQTVSVISGEFGVGTKDEFRDFLTGPRVGFCQELYGVEVETIG